MTREYLLRLDWPDKALSPNSHRHWRARHKATAFARHAAWAKCKARGVPKMDGAVLTFDFAPPDRRKRDLHNMPHSMKATIDGIADALGCDDSEILCRWPERFSPPVKGGAVLVHIQPRGSK